MLGINGILKGRLSIKQKILKILTSRRSLRADAYGWNAEDGEVIQQEKHIGLSDGFRGFCCYDCPMKAIGDGWRLMAPPITLPAYINGQDYYEWWFEKSS